MQGRSDVGLEGDDDGDVADVSSQKGELEGDGESLGHFRGDGKRCSRRW